MARIRIAECAHHTEHTKQVLWEMPPDPDLRRKCFEHARTQKDTQVFVLSALRYLSIANVTLPTHRVQNTKICFSRLVLMATYMINVLIYLKACHGEYSWALV